jgi:hypothetical protein
VKHYSKRAAFAKSLSLRSSANRSKAVEPRKNPLTAPTSRRSSKLVAWAHIATISSSLVAIAALAFGSYQFYETQKAQRESIALQKDAFEHELYAKGIELLLKYNELMLQSSPSASKSKKKEEWYWTQNLAVSMLEALFTLTRGSTEWEATVWWALQRHENFIRKNGLSCITYSSEFVTFLEKVFAAQPNSLCSDLNAFE